MSENQARLAAHERLSSGALAGWMRACASHPWRVMIAWVGIIAALILLVGTVGGSLKDEFEIPGSDTQKATDLIEAEFASEQGGVLNLVFAAPQGEQLDTPERRAAIEEAVQSLQGEDFAPTGTDPDGTAGITSVGDPFSDQTFSEDGRIAYAEAQFDRVIYEEDREQVVAVQEAVREAVEPVGVIVEFNGDAEFPPIEQGTQELLGLLAALIVLLIVFRTIVATAIPLALAIVALMTAFLLLFILAGLTDINTITPLLVSMIGLGVGIDYSLFIVTRFRQYLHEGLSPRDAAAEAGASAGRATIFAGLTVAISVTGLAFFGLDFITNVVFEATLIPAYFLIGGFGREGRGFAALKFLMYQLGGGLVHARLGHRPLRRLRPGRHPSYLLSDSAELDMTTTAERWLFVGFFIAFAVKAPLFPLHTWLADTTEKATPGTSVLLVCVLDKIGTFGMLRFCLGLLPEASRVGDPGRRHPGADLDRVRRAPRHRPGRHPAPDRSRPR